MRKPFFRPAAWLSLSLSLATAADVVYITDLTIFTELAPCAASAVGYNVMSMTYSACPEDVTALQSCVCSKDANSAAIKSQISSSVSYSCEATASDDQTSAASVYDAYCNQASVAAFPTPKIPVSQFITDIPAWANLAPCAQDALSYNVMGMTYSLCPADAPNLATCVCNKNQNSLRVSQGINSSVKYSCSSHTADISSAQAVFAAYCGLNDGTSSFPTTSDPPGDMTYYITGMAEYRSLAPCAQSALSYGVFSQTYYNCPSGPKALASCACLKDQMPSMVSSVIMSNVKYSCDRTALEDVTSALNVWDLYCSAAKALTTPAGVTESVAQTGATAKSGSGAGAAGPSATSKSNTGSGGNGTGETGVSSGSSKLPAIVGGAAGAALIIGLIGGIWFFTWRRKQARQNQQLNQNTAPTGQYFSPNDGKAELDSTAILAPASSPRPSTLKPAPPSRGDNVSPVSSHTPGPLPLHSELQGQHMFPPPAPEHPVLQGQNAYSPQWQFPYPPQHHAYGHAPSPVSPISPSMAQGQQSYEMSGQQRPQVYEMHGMPAQPQRAELGGMSWQSGPVNTYHEMDGGWEGPGQHSR